MSHFRLYDFLPYIEKTTFGIACDAMANFRVSIAISHDLHPNIFAEQLEMCVCVDYQELLTRHKPMVAEFLEENYDEVSMIFLYDI